MKYPNPKGNPSLSKKLIVLFLIIPFGINLYSQSYTISGSNGQTVNTCTGVFYDSGGSGSQYGNDETYTVTFCSNNGNAIRFDFTSFNVRFGDTLYIYDGSNTSSPVFGKYSGGLAPGSLNSSGTCLTFKFVSDTLFTRPGWAANISCCPPPVISPIIPSEVTQCAGSIVKYSVASHAGSTYNWTVINGTPASTIGGTNNLDITWDIDGGVTGYVEVVEVNSCGSRDSIELIVDIYSLPAVNFSGLNAYYCFYSTPVTITGFPAGGIFSGPGISGNTFTPAVAGAGTHSIIYDYLDPATGCTNQKMIQTTITVPQVFIVGASANSYCAGFGVNITLSGSEAGFSYQLLKNGLNDGIPVAGTGSALTWTNKQNGAYTVIAIHVITSCTNNMSGSQTITQNPLPLPTFTAQPGATTCSSVSAAYTTQPGQSNYIWGFTGVAGTDYTTISGGSTSDNSVTLIWLTPGSKSVTINYTNTNGCTAVAPTSSSVTIVTLSPPVPTGAAVQNFCSETSPTVANLSATGTAIQWYSAASGGSPLLSSTPLSNNQHYYASQTIAGCESITRLDVTALIFSIPLPPIAGAGTGATCSRITANWAASAGAASYRLDVSTINTFATYVAGYQDRNVGNVTTYNVTGLTAGVIYYYRVRAVDFCGTSGNSLTITYATLPATPATPGAIAGTTPQCPGVSGQIYSISLVTNATTYTWTVPTGWAITSGLGTTTITVNTGAVGQNGNITVTAGNICGTSAPSTLAVTVIPNASITSVTGASPLCIGGTATYTANGLVLGGGTGVWSSSNPAAATVSAAGLATGISAGTSNIIYTITGGCGGTVSAQQSVTIRPNASITSVTGTSPLCIGGTATYTANGVVLSGGAGAWSSSNPAVATANAAGLVTGISAGTSNIIYTITGGCGGIKSAQLLLTIIPNASITSVTGTNPLCIGGIATYTANGVVLSGGTGAWSSSNPAVANVSAAGLVTGISAGTSNIKYTITGGCGGLKSAQLLLMIIPNASITSVTGASPLCIGGTTTYAANGVVPGGGTGAWSSSNPAVANVNATGLVTGISAGISNIIYTIAGGCGGVVTSSASITVTTTPTAAISYSGSPWCSSSGVQSVTFVGTPGGTYSSAPAGLSINTVTGEITPGSSLAATYTITYTLVSGGCGIVTTTTTVTINQMPTVNITDPAGVCSPATVDLTAGEVTAGSSSGLSYSFWRDAAATLVYGSPANATSGTYYIKGTNGLGCSDIKPVTATVNPIPVVTSSQTDVLCSGASTGAIDITVAGGTGSYNYAWTGNGVTATDEDQTGLSAGLYSVVATDANSCSSAALDVTINEPSAISGTITSQTNVSVFGGNDGSVTVDGSGGIAPYQYKIGAGIYQASGSFGTLTAGSHTVTIQDNNLCTFDVLVTITQPLPPLSGSIITQSDVACFGTSTGSVTMEGSGGLAPYEYSLDGGPFQPSGTFGTLAAGIHTVTVRDATLNTHDVSITINQPADALGGLVTSLADVLCFGGNTGSVTVEGSGGISPYQYKIGTGLYQTSGTFGSLSAGTYTVTIQDVNLCAFDVSVTIIHLTEALTASIKSHTDITCSGAVNGSITIDGSGGVLPYEYSISGGPFQVSGTFNGLDASTYTITVRDANLCTADVSATIMEPAAITIGYTKDDVSCPGVSDGKIILSITGGRAPYVTIWSDNITTKDRVNIPEGTYTVVVRDMIGCNESLVVIIDVIGSEGCLEIPTIITPNNDGYNDTWVIKNIDLFPDAEVFVFNRWGKRVFQTKNLLANPWDGTIDGKLLPTDSYHYVLHLNDGSDPRSGVISIIK